MATRNEQITYAVSLLQAGALVSMLPGRLMQKYGITPAAAQAIAAAAIKRHRAKKPVDK